jgi:hypothetical protein
MALNWGTRILFLYVGFVALMGVLVWKSMHTQVNLVTEDYYAQELSFQHKLDAENATAALTQRPVISATPDAVLVFFPHEFSALPVEAKLHFYYAPDGAMDKEFDRLATSSGRLSIPRNALPALRYTAKLSWQCAGRNYYQETPLNLSWQ